MSSATVVSRTLVRVGATTIQIDADEREMLLYEMTRLPTVETRHGVRRQHVTSTSRRTSFARCSSRSASSS